MKKIKFIFPSGLMLSLALVSLFGTGCWPRKDPPDPEPDACEYAVHYKLNGQWVQKTEAQVTAEIWPASSNNIGRKVYDIWSDQNPDFYFHSSASGQGETSGLVADWLQTSGSHLIIDGQVITGQFTFQVVQEASGQGDLVKISFSGTTAGGDQIQDGLICTYIDQIH